MSGPNELLPPVNLRNLRAQLDVVLNKKATDVAEIIRAAVGAGIPVDILVPTKDLIPFAQRRLEKFGAPEGSKAYAESELDRCFNQDHFQVKLDHWLPG